MTPHTNLACGVFVACGAIVALVWLAPACGQTTDYEPPPSDAATASQQWPDPTACVPLSACITSACPSNPDGGFGCYWQCGQASLCGAVQFTSGGNPCSSSGCSAGSDASTTYTVNTTNARCVLTAMRDGTLGEITWGSSVSAEDLSSSYHEDVNLVASRQAFGWWQETDDSQTYQRYAGKQLQAASFFQTCLDSNDVATYLSCLQNAYGSCP